jgi:hypothetical protein
MLTKRILLYGGLMACVLPGSLSSQTSARKALAAPTGLKILSTTIDPETRAVIVHVQNTTNRTAVAFSLTFHQFDQDGKDTTPDGYGVAVDHAEPYSLPNETGQFIQPGQLDSIQLTSANPGTISVTATIVGVVYEDRSAEGLAAQLFFISRARNAREAREQAAQEQGEKKAQLEKRAEWYEAHGPLEPVPSGAALPVPDSLLYLAASRRIAGTKAFADRLKAEHKDDRPMRNSLKNRLGLTDAEYQAVEAIALDYVAADQKYFDDRTQLAKSLSGTDRAVQRAQLQAQDVAHAAETEALIDLFHKVLGERFHLLDDWAHSEVLPSVGNSQMQREAK